MASKLLTLTLAILLLPLCLMGQNQQGKYIKIDYLEVNQQQLDRFTDSVIDRLKEIQRDRVSSADIDSWAIYRVLYSGSAYRDYNFVSVTVSDSMSSFDSFNSSFTDAIRLESERNRYAISKSEIWTIRNSLNDNQSEAPSNYMMMDYMEVKLGRELEYQMLEDEVAKPLHEERLETDTMEGWEMYQLVTPGGINYGYNFATGNYFTDLDHIEFGFNEELIRSQNPNVDLMEFFNQIWSTRDLVRSEVWQLIDYTN
ncbi:MAG: hypothetical protein ACQERO_04285 [Bacteroidota bacterium]